MRNQKVRGFEGFLLLSIDSAGVQSLRTFAVRHDAQQAALELARSGNKVAVLPAWTVGIPVSGDPNYIEDE